MLAAVKMPRTKFKVEGDIPAWLLVELKRRYRKSLSLAPEEKDDDETTVNVSDTEWFKNIEVTPGQALRVYRQNRGLTQEQVARRLGAGVKKQHVSDMENGRRTISRKIAKKLAALFTTSAARFI